MRPRTTHTGPPPGWITASQAAQRLSHSRQAFYASGLADWLESWKVGRLRLYRSGDVAQLADLIAARPGLRALGIIDGNAPLIPDDSLWKAWLDDELTIECPKCGKQAVWRQVLGELGTPDEVWCPQCG